jgi:D-alanine-D-alanine ligase
VYNRVQRVALKAYKSLGCSGFARIDSIVDKDGVPYVHDANTIPGMTDLSDLPAQAKADGISYEDLVLHILASALE